MGKSKNKKRIKQNIISNSLKSSDCNLLENLKAEEMQHIIARAIVEAEDIKTKKLEKQRQDDISEWYGIIGRKEYQSGSEKFWNTIAVIKKILFLSKKDIKDDRVSLTLLKTILVGFFNIINWGMFLFAIFLFVRLPIQCFSENICQFPWDLYICHVVFAVFIFMSSRLFRLISIEVDNIKDRNYLFSFFTSITSFISIILAVIALTKAG